MKTYGEALLPQNVLSLFDEIRRVWQELPEIDLGIDRDGEKILLSCQMITECLAFFYPVKVIYGYFLNPLWFHCWLVPRCDFYDDSNYPVLIDVYQVASAGGGPKLYITKWPSPWHKIYVENSRAKKRATTRYISAIGRLCKILPGIISKAKNNPGN